MFSLKKSKRDSSLQGSYFNGWYLMQKFQFKQYCSLSSEEFTAWSVPSALSLACVWAKNRAPAFKSHCHVRRKSYLAIVTLPCRELRQICPCCKKETGMVSTKLLSLCETAFWGLRWLLYPSCYSHQKTLMQANMALCTALQPHTTSVPLQHLRSTFDFAKKKK